MSYSKHYSSIKKGLKGLGDNTLTLEQSIPLYKKTKKELDAIEGVLRKLESDINKISISTKVSKDDSSLSQLIESSQENINLLQSETDPDNVLTLYTQIVAKLKNAEYMVENANLELEQI